MDKRWLAAAAVFLAIFALALLLPSGQKPPSQPSASPAQPNQSGIPPSAPSRQPNVSQPPAPSVAPNKTIRIASWNLQAFGQTKASNQSLMALYAGIMRQYDVIFIEEIRDSAGTAFPRLCSLLEGYLCLNSSRAGRTTSKEQYGVIYKGVEVTGTRDYNPDAQDRWERPPFQVSFRQGNYSFTVLVEHTKPDDAPSEISALEEVAANLSGNAAVLGDLNADCSYYPHKSDFSGWFWAIATGTDTTSRNTSCTYDRIIFNSEMKNEFVSSGVFSANITPAVSDHYLVWSEIAPLEGGAA